MKIANFRDSNGPQIVILDLFNLKKIGNVVDTSKFDINKTKVRNILLFSRKKYEWLVAI